MPTARKAVLSGKRKRSQSDVQQRKATSSLEMTMDDFEDEEPLFRMPKRTQKQRTESSQCVLNTQRSKKHTEAQETSLDKPMNKSQDSDGKLHKDKSEVDRPEPLCGSFSDKAIVSEGPPECLEQSIEELEKSICTDSEKLCPTCKRIVPVAVMPSHTKRCLRQFQFSKRLDAHDSQFAPLRATAAKDQQLTSPQDVEKGIGGGSRAAVPRTCLRKRTDPEMELALALSSSLVEEEVDRRGEEEEKLLKLGLDEVVEEQRKERPIFRFTQEKEPAARRRKIKGGCRNTLLMTMSAETRHSLVSEKVAMILSSECSRTLKCRAERKPSRCLSQFENQTSHLWDCSHSSNDDPLESNYVQELSEFIEPKHIPVGNLLRSLSQLPGRLNTTALYKNDSEDECSDQESFDSNRGAVNHSPEETIIDSYCTYLALAEIMDSPSPSCKISLEEENERDNPVSGEPVCAANAGCQDSDVIVLSEKKRNENLHECFLHDEADESIRSTSSSQNDALDTGDSELQHDKQQSSETDTNLGGFLELQLNSEHVEEDHKSHSLSTIGKPLFVPVDIQGSTGEAETVADITFSPQVNTLESNDSCKTYGVAWQCEQKVRSPDASECNYNVVNCPMSAAVINRSTVLDMGKKEVAQTMREAVMDCKHSTNVAATELILAASVCVGRNACQNKSECSIAAFDSSDNVQCVDASGVHDLKKAMLDKLVFDWGCLLASEDGSDISIVASGISIQTHSLVLKVRCPDLLKESKENVIHWDLVTYDCAVHFLEYMYTGKCSFAVENDSELISSLQILAKKYYCQELYEYLLQSQRKHVMQISAEPDDVTKRKVDVSNANCSPDIFLQVTINTESTGRETDYLVNDRSVNSPSFSCERESNLSVPIHSGRSKNKSVRKLSFDTDSVTVIAGNLDLNEEESVRKANSAEQSGLTGHQEGADLNSSLEESEMCASEGNSCLTDKNSLCVSGQPSGNQEAAEVVDLTYSDVEDSPDGSSPKSHKAVESSFPVSPRVAGLQVNSLSESKKPWSVNNESHIADVWEHFDEGGYGPEVYVGAQSSSERNGLLSTNVSGGWLNSAGKVQDMDVIFAGVSPSKEFASCEVNSSSAKWLSPKKNISPRKQSRALGRSKRMSSSMKCKNTVRKEHVSSGKAALGDQCSHRTCEQSVNTPVPAMQDSFDCGIGDTTMLQVAEDLEQTSIVSGVSECVNEGGNRSESSEKFVCSSVGGLDTPDKENITPNKEVITPMPDFKKMFTPEIKRQLDKYGIRKLSKKKAITLLTHIYEQLHPVLTDSETETPVAGRRIGKRVPSPERYKNRKKILGKRKEDPKSSNMASAQEDRDDVLNLSQTSVTSSEYSEAECLEESLNETEFPVGTSPDQEVTGNLSEEILKFIEKNEALHSQILLYDPIYAPDLLCKLKESGLKCSMGKLIDFLDEQWSQNSAKEEWQKEANLRAGLHPEWCFKPRVAVCP